MNRAIIRGNLTKDPELRFTPGGGAIAQFFIGVNRRWKTNTNERKEEASFFECEAWGPVGENIAEHFHKGNPILLEGHLKEDRWNDKTSGQQRSKVVIVVDNWEFIDSKRETEPAKEGARPPAPSTTAVDKFKEDENSVPF